VSSQRNPTGKQSRSQLGWALGGVVTLAILLTCGLTWVFAYNQLGYEYFWERPGEISGEQWQYHIRNAATLVGVPGVAAALVFSYFKQRTSDRTQETTAAVLQLQQEQHDSEIVSRLRDRYTAAAEQLGHSSPAVQLAGVYALAGLADDWGALGRIKDRQDCIDMLISTLETTEQEQSQESSNSLTHIEGRIYRIFKQHFDLSPTEGRSWSDVDANLSNYKRRWGPGAQWSFSGGEKVFRAETISTGGTTVLQNSKLGGTAAVVIRVSDPSRPILIHQVVVTGDSSFGIEWERAPTDQVVPVKLQHSRLHGGQIKLIEWMSPAPKRILYFKDCQFHGTRIRLPERAGSYKITFDSCTFGVNPFFQKILDDERPEIEIVGMSQFGQALNQFAAKRDASLLDEEWLQ
jgi:hypothetical protein